MYLFAVKPYTPQGDIQTILDTVEEKEALLALPYSSMGEFPGYKIGALHLPSVEKNSFTGSVAALLPKSMHAQFALVTEREEVEALWETDVEPFLCIGESLEDVQKENSAEVIARQVTSAIGDNPVKPYSLVYLAPWSDEMQHLPPEGELQHRFEFCRDLVHSLYPSKPTVYCISPTWAPDLQAEDYFVKL